MALPDTHAPEWAIVVPTVGRESLYRLLAILADQPGIDAGTVVVVDDRPVGPDGAAHGGPDPDGERGGPARGPAGDPTRADGHVPEKLRWLRSHGRGPAAARNVGWRAVAARWIVFLDDDVEPTARWLEDLRADLARAGDAVIGVQGRIEVPLPRGRRPTDWERQTAALADARWATADMAYRRSALCRTGGFDDRFPRAYREDADLAMRAARWGRLERGQRRTIHPVRSTPWWTSVARQRGNADDMLMRRLHGRRWRERCGAPAGRRPVHLVTSAALAGTAAALLTGRRRAALGAGAVWSAATAEFALRRIAPGPRTRDEVASMVVTSAVIPLAAVWWTAVGMARAAALPSRTTVRRAAEAVLFDRDGTLVHDVAYNDDPARVQPVDDAREVVGRLRDAGLAVCVVSNQSGIGRGLITTEAVERCNARLDELLGPFDATAYCPHAPHDGCRCRKPKPGMLEAIAAKLGVHPDRCVVIGDIAADTEAAARAGARWVLVPAPATRPEEVATAPVVANSLSEAADMVLQGVV